MIISAFVIIFISFRVYQHIYVWKVVFSIYPFLGHSFLLVVPILWITIPLYNQGQEKVLYIINPWWLNGSITKLGKYQIFLLFLLYFLCKHNCISSSFYFIIFAKGNLLTPNFSPPKVVLLRYFIMLILYHVIDFFLGPFSCNLIILCARYPNIDASLHNISY